MIPRLFPRLPRLLPLPRPAATRPLCTTPILSKALPPRPKPPPDSEIEESYLKGSGPGGQKINKTNSAVQLKHTPTGIVVKSQATRSRTQNRKHARELLAQKVDELLHGDQSRSAVVGRIMQKRAASADKKKRRKYRAADGEADGEAGDIEASHGPEQGRDDVHTGESSGDKSADRPTTQEAADRQPVEQSAEQADPTQTIPETTKTQ